MTTIRYLGSLDDVGRKKNVRYQVITIIQTDRPKSVRNRCVIKLFCGIALLSLCPFEISAGVGAFVLGLSQISSFFSQYFELELN